MKIPKEKIEEEMLYLTENSFNLFGYDVVIAKEELGEWVFYATGNDQGYSYEHMTVLIPIPIEVVLSMGRILGY